MRSRLPSFTLTLTTTVSPGRKSGSRRDICSASNCWIRFMAVTRKRVWARLKTRKYARALRPAQAGFRRNADASHTAARRCPVGSGAGGPARVPVCDEAGQQLAVLPVQPGPRQQVRPAQPGAAQGLLPPPACDGGMVATQEHLRHVAQLVVLRPGPVPAVEQAVAEGVLACRVGIAQRPVEQATNGIDEDAGRQLATGEDVVAH